MAPRECITGEVEKRMFLICLFFQYVENRICFVFRRGSSMEDGVWAGKLASIVQEFRK